MWRKAADVSFWLGLSLYTGGLITLGAIVAPSILDTATNSQLSMPAVTAPPLSMPRQVTGELFGHILNRFAWVEIIALALMLVGLAIWFLGHKIIRRSTWVLLILWAMVAGLTAYDAAAIRPRVWTLNATLRQLAAASPAATSPTSWPEQQQFDDLHHRSETFGRLKAYMLLAMILVTAWRGLAEKRTHSSSNIPVP